MRARRAVVSLTLAAVAAIPAPAFAGPPTAGPAGRLCAYSSVTDPWLEAGENTMLGQVNAGPAIAVTGGALRCSIRVNNNSHVGAASRGP